MMIVEGKARTKKPKTTSSTSKPSSINNKKKNKNSKSKMTAKATISEEPPVSPSRWSNTQRRWCQEGNTIGSPGVHVDNNDENDVHYDSSSSSSGPISPQLKQKQQPQQKNPLVDSQKLKRKQSSGCSADADSSNGRLSSLSSKASSNSVVYTASNDEFGLCSDLNNVRFGVANHKQDTMCLDDYTEEEFKNCWYSPEEKRKKMKQREKIVARMEAGKPPKNHNMTYRGLEAWTQEGSDRLEQQIARCIDAIMDEQDVQWQKNTDDFEKLAACSLQISIQSTELALERAAVDELEAMEAHQMVDGDSDVEGDENSVVTSPSVQLPRNRRAGRRPKQPRRRHRNDPQIPADTVTSSEEAVEMTVQPPGSLATDISKSYSNQLLNEMQSSTKARRFSEDELFGLTPTNSVGDSSSSTGKSTGMDEDDDARCIDTDISNHGMKKKDRWASIGSRNIAPGDDQDKGNSTNKVPSSSPQKRIWSVRNHIIDTFRRPSSDKQKGPSSTKSNITESGHTQPLSCSLHSDMLQSPTSLNGSLTTRLSSSLSNPNDFLLSPKRVESISSIQVEENGTLTSPSNKRPTPKKKATGKSSKSKRRSVSLSSPLPGAVPKKKDSVQQRSLSDAITIATIAEKGSPIVKKKPKKRSSVSADEAVPPPPPSTGASPKIKTKRRSSLGATEVPPPPPPPLKSSASPKIKKSKRRSSLGALEAPPPPPPLPPSSPSPSPKGRKKRRSSISSVEVWSKHSGNEGSYDLKDGSGATSKIPFKKKPGRRSSIGSIHVGSERWAEKDEIGSDKSPLDKSPNRVTRSPSNTLGKKPYQPTTSSSSKDQEGSLRSRSKDRKSSKRAVADAPKRSASKDSKKKQESSSSHSRRSRSSSPGKKSKKKLSSSSSSDKLEKKSSSKSRSRSLSAGKYSNREAIKNRKSRATKDIRPRSASPKRKADQAKDLLNPNSLRSCKTTTDSTLRIVGSNIEAATPEVTKKREPTLVETKKQLQEGLPEVPFSSPQYKGESSPKFKGGKKFLMGKIRGILDSPTPGFPKKYGATSAKLPRCSDATETTDETDETNSPPKEQKKQRRGSLFGGFRSPLVGP